jgi:hypothetical protein
MSTHVILVDLLGLVCAAAGFHLAFRQRLVRNWIDAARGRRGRLPLRRAAAGDAEDPVHYAMIIFGTMLMAFGLIIIAFTTVFALTA